MEALQSIQESLRRIIPPPFVEKQQIYVSHLLTPWKQYSDLLFFYSHIVYGLEF